VSDPDLPASSAAQTTVRLPTIRFQGAVALLGTFPALAGIDLEVSAGELVVLRGPNGAGKSTVLRACAGLVPVVEGEAEVLGVDLVAHPRDVRTLVGMLGHGAGLYDELTVAENVRFWTRARKVDPARADDAMARFGLAGRLASVAASRLSAGQKRRVALACLVAQDARLWLLDEPHAALDADGRTLVDQLVAEAVAAGTTVLLASHEVDQVASLHARVVTIAGGTVVGDEPAPAAKEAARVP
jgi:heme ABC exporter ATP-binding subunit CcmA